MIVRNGARGRGECRRLRPPVRLWISKVRRAGYFSPLALALAATMVATSFAPLSGPGVARQAEAQIVIGGCAPDASRIIQKICDENGSPIAGLAGFEATMIDAFLQAHQLPPEDRALVLKYERTGVRSAMLTKILAIAQTAADERTPEDQAVYQWFQGLVWKNEKALIQEAIDEYGAWFQDACGYTLDPDVAAAYNLQYSGAPYCHPDPFSLGPDAPDKNYFLAVGNKNSYGDKVTSDPRGPAITAATARGIAFFVTVPVIGTLAGVAAALGTSVLISTGVAASIFPFAVKAGALAGVAAGGVAAAVFIVLLAVVIGVLAAIKVFSPSALSELQAMQTATLAAPPNLATFTDGVGFMKVNQTLVAQTLPDFSSSEAPPERQPGDAVFVVQPAAGNAHASETVTYRESETVVKTVTPVGGWFVVSQTSSDGTVTRDMTLSFDYLDSSGRKWTAWRVGDTFLSTKREVDPAFTTPDFAGTTLTLLDGTGAPISVSIGHPPAITSADTTAFSIGAANSFTVTTTGTTPRITLAAGALPTGVLFTDKGDGTATISGTPAAGTAGTYPLTLMATSVAGSTSQSFTLNAGTAPVFASAPPLIFREGTAASLTIRATGAPLPAIRLDTLIKCNLDTGVCAPGGGPNLPSGLTFGDSGDGTATITGTPAAGTSGVIYATHYLSAINANGTVTATLNVQVNAPLAITSDSGTTFASGVAGTFTVRATGGLPSLSAAGTLPAGVTFTDKGDGTATIAGTPPAGTRGTFPLTLKATESGDETTQAFTLRVVPKVTALGPAKAWIGLGNSDDVGLRVDVLAEVFLQAGATVTRIGRGQADNQPAGSSGFPNAVLATVAISPVGDAPVVPEGAQLEYKLSVRRTCAPATNHKAGKAMLWYNGRAVDSGTARDAGSRIAATVGGAAADLFLRPALALNGSSGTSKTSLTVALTSAEPCPGRSFTPFGTWITTLP